MNEPTPTSNPNERLLIVLSHLSLLLGAGFLLPLVVYLIQTDRTGPVAANAREALNFHLSVYFYALVCLPLVLVVIGVPLIALLGIAAAILAIIASVRSSDGSPYRYPLTIRLI